MLLQLHYIHITVINTWEENSIQILFSKKNLIKELWVFKLNSNIRGYFHMAILAIFPKSSLRKQIVRATYILVQIFQTISVSGNDRKVDSHTYRKSKM